MKHSPLNKFICQTLVPLFLILVCPPTVFLFWYANTALDGSFSQLFMTMYNEGLWETLSKAWFPYFWGSSEAWRILGIYAGIQLIFMRFLPGKLFHGPITPAGNIPVYKANGVVAYFATLALFFLGSYQFQLFSAAILYNHLPYILGALNIFGLVLCVLLLFKGYWFPSSTDCGGSGNIIFDYYWGTELYPRFFGWDLKMFTNCRIAMMGWPLLIISYAAKQQELHGLSDSMLIAVALQLIYVTKFFYWETGYLSSLDIMHDRAGFYICWAILVWLPGIYTSPTLYLVHHPIHLGLFWSFLIFALGSACIMINYYADRQRQRVRSTEGQCEIWKKPPVFDVVSYTTEKGETKQSILLASGWWGITRHFHYVPEILGAFFWSVPALFGSFLPYFYVIFLTILLTHRAFRDDERCARKYGTGWERYCSKVPYKMIPYVV